jgi:hypothetical protein
MKAMSKSQTPPEFVIRLFTGLLIICTTIGAVMIIRSLEPRMQIPVQIAKITVAYGDTLWNIAQHIAPDIDPRRVVWEIQTLNQIDTPEIFPGQVLKVPVYN